MRIQVILAAMTALVGAASMETAIVASPSTAAVARQGSGTEGPVITPSDDGSGFSVTLWPPNRQFQSLVLSDCVLSAVDASGDPIDVNAFGVIDRITSDEGTTSPDGDMAISGSSTAALRAAREGPGDGRVYSIFYRVFDQSGNATAAVCRVQVPHNPATPAIDSGVHECIGAGC